MECNETPKKKMTKQAVVAVSPTDSVEVGCAKTPIKINEQFNIEGALKFLIKSQVQMAQKFEIIETTKNKFYF
ncbi:hypothetical protein ACI65C_006674 [Semiaphis heraclei]